MPPDDNFTESGIQSGLETLLFGRKDFYFYDEIDSTNTRAAILAGNGSPEGTVVIADRQSKGRGQKERTWFSPRGAGIYISLILRPAIPPADAPKITLLTAVSVAEAIAATAGLNARIKWPNDILINEKKIAGILSGMDADVDRINNVIVGVGINVNTRKDTLPGEIADTATSIRIETGTDASRPALVRAFLDRFEKLYFEFIRSGFERILARWKELSCILGKEVQVTGSGEPVIGLVVDIDRDGILLLRDREGAVHRISSGDVSPAGTFRP